ncbi:MAG: hypothetical protein WCF57_20995 [Pyrinomonadaceae bacterium]
MSRKAPATGARGGKSKRGRTLLWIGVTVAIISALLYWEKIALLYVLATLGVTALMIGAAMVDLAGTKRITAGTAVPADDAAAIGTGIASAMPSAMSSAPRTAKRR